MYDYTYDYNFIIQIYLLNIICIDLKTLYKPEINYIYYHVKRKNASIKR